MVCIITFPSPPFAGLHQAVQPGFDGKQGTHLTSRRYRQGVPAIYGIDCVTHFCFVYSPIGIYVYPESQMVYFGIVLLFYRYFWTFNLNYNAYVKRAGPVPTGVWSCMFDLSYIWRPAISALARLNRSILGPAKTLVDARDDNPLLASGSRRHRCSLVRTCST